MTVATAFRGVQGIREIKSRMLPLVAWYRKFKPHVTELVIERTDYDLIARWPRAANSEQFLIGDNGIYYDGFRLTFDTGQGRYDKKQAPEQAVIA